ncbi:protein of unknown function [Bartonella clarridgeiae 73]|uniref:Uncharacterized protein n=1 Tax=Bartonella clarridgeiae (strain CCUG 45776 / CIP 104772 / 73) TaxID=696125 RepID=E6YGB0_BARC7|nr:protein of unknown function [Bartonella clarridgeiae 73]
MLKGILAILYNEDMNNKKSKKADIDETIKIIVPHRIRNNNLVPGLSR